MIRDLETGNVFNFDAIRDIEEVKSGLSIDLTDALKTGVIPSESSPLDNNGIDDPERIIGVARDKFDVIDAQRALRKFGEHAKIKSSIAAAPASAEKPAE